MRHRDKYRLAGFLARDRFHSFFGSLRGTVRILGDIVSPPIYDQDGTWWDEDEVDEL